MNCSLYCFGNVSAEAPVSVILIALPTAHAHGIRWATQVGYSSESLNSHSVCKKASPSLCEHVCVRCSAKYI